MSLCYLHGLRVWGEALAGSNGRWRMSNSGAAPHRVSHYDDEHPTSVPLKVLLGSSSQDYKWKEKVIADGHKTSHSHKPYAIAPHATSVVQLLENES